MATIYAIKGLLLEEVLLNLLKESGYSTVNNANNDATLKQGHSGIEVKGRGWNHQIDAIADFIMTPPFSYPVRLLLEAKFYSSKVGIDIIRNAVGVLKDVDEYWVTNNNEISKQRFNYQYAVFTSSSFTNPAQRYAFAQDIYLIKLENNKYFLPIVSSIRNLEYQDFNGTSNDNININLSELRTKVRESLKHQSQSILSTYITSKGFSSNKFNTLYEASTTLNSSFLGMLDQRFPVFLTPSPTFDIIDLINNPTIRICWDDDYWYIVKNNADCRLLEEDDILFSFDLPDELFNLYADNDMLTQHNALNLKEELMSTIQIIFKNADQSIMSSLELKLDNQWLENIREHINTEDR
nr:restriction endonuclease [Malaciobacter halophilus]